MTHQNDRLIYNYTDKFKYCAYSISLISEYSDFDFQFKSILAYIMGRYSKNYPSNHTMYKYKLDLFGPKVSANVERRSNYNILTINFNFLTNNYTGLSISKNHDFIKEILFNTYISKELYENECNNLRNLRLRILDNPNAKALDYAFKEIDQSLALSNFLDYEIKYEDFIKQYQKLYDDVGVSFIYNGSHDKGIITTFFNSLNIKHNNKKVEFEDFDLSKLKDLSYELNLDQSVLIMFFKTSKKYLSTKATRLGYASSILSGSMASLLFADVREKHNLCYNIHLGTIPGINLYYVVTGISKQNIEKAQELILKQFSRVLNKDYEDEVLVSCLNELKSNIKLNLDQLNSLNQIKHEYNFIDSEYDLEARLKLIDELNKDVIAEEISDLEYLSSCVIKGQN